MNRRVTSKNHPRISIVIATYNSEKLLPLVLQSIKRQDYPKERIETLVIDGGSTDKTLEIVRLYDCKIIANVKKEPIHAKYLGFLKASGKYIVYLDSDEVMENPQSLQLKVDIFKQNPKVKAVIPSGYKNPKDYSRINNYINEFGDPFSFFIYTLSKDATLFIPTLLKKYKKVSEDEKGIIFNFYKKTPQPIIELVAMGSMTDLEYLRACHPEIKKNSSLIPFFFYLLNTKSIYIAVAKNDIIYHYSSDSIKRYLKKISSRVKNNVFKTTMGRGGFIGRDTYQPFWFRMKKYLFLPYSFSLLFPLLDSFSLAITRRKSVYMIHSLLCLYTAILILYYSFLKVLAIKPAIKGYGR